jgi:cyclopropane fatty-acyl-phospholipid synthase-like methyltransferase
MIIDELNKKQQSISNSDVDWAKHYDLFEIEMRNMYRTVAKPQNDSHFQMLLNNAKDHLNKNKSFCEIGFGCGITLRYAAKYFGNVYGLDISPRNVEYTADELRDEGVKNVELYCSDIMKTDERFLKKFDVLSFIHGLEHFAEKDYGIMLGNIRSYLKPGGIFTGALPYKNEFNYRMCHKCGNVFEMDGHVSSHDENSLRKVLEENGFEVLYLNNFNIHYALNEGNILQKIHRVLLYKFFGRRFFTQLEYVAKPKLNSN